MDLIKESFNSLTSHIKKYNLNRDSNFTFFDDSNSLEDKSIYFLGTSINQDKTPQNKISFSNSEYIQNSNFFDLYYAIFIEKKEELIAILRVLIDFPNDNDGNKFDVLNNSAVDLNKNFYIKYFLNNLNSDNNLLLSNFIFVKSEAKIITLKEIPITSKVSKVSIVTKRK